MKRDFGSRASDFFLAPLSDECPCLAYLLSPAPLHQFPFAHSALRALSPDNVANLLPSPAELGLTQLFFLHLAQDRMNELSSP